MALFCCFFSMDQNYSVLVTLQENLPESYSDESLEMLEQIVTHYKEILHLVAETADQDNNTAYYRRRINAIESQLRDARYEHSEKQRRTAFEEARENTDMGIKALLFHLNGSKEVW